VILDLIVAESQKNLQLEEELKNNISRLPRGIVKERKVNGKTYYYLAYRENRKVVNKYIGDNSLKAKKISKLVKERKAFENHLKQLQKDWKIYNKIGIEENSSELMQVITESAKGKDFNLSLRGFLDIFYSNKDNKEKMFALIKREPLPYKNVPNYQYAMCAAAANKLSNDYCLEVPSWAWKGRYYMKEMYFSGIGKGRLRIYNMLYSPAEFKHRGLFVDENILVRV